MIAQYGVEVTAELERKSATPTHYKAADYLELAEKYKRLTQTLLDAEVW